MQKFYWTNPGYQTNNKERNIPERKLPTPAPNLSSYYPTLTLPVNTPKCGVQVNIKSNDQHQAMCQGQQRGSHRVLVRLSSPTSEKMDMSDITSDMKTMQLSDLYLAATNPPVRLRQRDKVGQGLKHKNKTWNQNTLSTAQYEYGIDSETRKVKRQSIQNIDFFNHNYENVDNTNDVAIAAKCLQTPNPLPKRNLNASDAKPQGSGRQTPRSRKKGKSPKPVYRSKSCDRGATVLDNLWRLSDRLTSSLGGGSQDCKLPAITSDTSASCLDDQHPPPPPVTPTSSIFQSVAARAIPCVEMKAPCTAGNGRVSPTDSLAYHSAYLDYEKDPVRPAQNLAHRMRGRLEYVNKKMNMIRSRSAERLRGCTSAVRSEVITVADTRKRPELSKLDGVYSGPFIGQARAITDCVPSPYDRDALPFSKDDLIDIIAMNASGLWRGRCGDRVGNFKFINVEILSNRCRRRSRSRSLRKIKRKPGTIAEVMKVINMDEHLPVFVLNGYENLTLFKDLDDEELDYLGISDNNQREKLLAIAELLFPDDTKEDHESDNSSDDSSESGFADVNSDESNISRNSRKVKLKRMQSILN